MQIAQYQLKNRVLAAPMAGVSDAVFRKLALDYGADMAVSEMVAAKAMLKGSTKTRWRLKNIDEGIRCVQIVGHDPSDMANAAKFNVDLGAQIIDINMGCPAKKVCNKLAGSALLADENQVKRILEAVIDAVDIPVTLKIRTGSTPDQRNGVKIAQIAQDSGIQSLVVHGRTRACRFKGEAEYETIKQIKAVVGIPIIANGDIDSPEKAVKVLDLTEADAVMIGRAAQGKPWIYQQIATFLQSGKRVDDPSTEQIGKLLLFVLEQMYRLYGEYSGVRIARKHISWYVKNIENSNEFRKKVNLVESSAEQFKMTHAFFQNQSPDIKIAA